MAKRTAVYPGTFDPITNGHVDIITRATRLVDRLVVGVAANPGKGPIFGLDDRLDLVRTEVEDIARTSGAEIEVVAFSNLLMHFAAECGAVMIIRGLRAVTDFDYEFQMVGMNARVNPEIETVFLMASENHTFISSRFVKEIALLNGNVTSFVPPRVHKRLIAQVNVINSLTSE